MVHPKPWVGHMFPWCFHHFASFLWHVAISWCHGATSSSCLNTSGITCWPPGPLSGKARRTWTKLWTWRSGRGRAGQPICLGENIWENHWKMVVKWWLNGGFMVVSWDFRGTYPLVICYMAIENDHSFHYFSGKTHYFNGPFSTAMLNYQSVTQRSLGATIGIIRVERCWK